MPCTKQDQRYTFSWGSQHPARLNYVQADQVTVKIPADFQLEEDLPTVMSQLSTFIYKHGEERSKARAMLCCIFFEAIHNNFYTVSQSVTPITLPQ